MAASVPHVTVAVAVRDRRDQLIACLTSLAAQRYPSFDIVVLDNESTDGSGDAARALGRDVEIPVRVVDVEGPLGRVRAEAVAHCKGDVLAFTDSDCVADSGWLAAGVAALTADRRRGVVQGRTLPQPDVLTGRWAATQRIEVETLLFECCNLFYRADAIRGAEGFDVGDGFFCEDTVAGWSVRRRGWGSAFAADAVVYHAVTHPGLRWHLRRALRYGRFASAARRHPELRDAVFWRRWFLRRRSAAFAAAAVGTSLALATRRRAPLVATLPYVWMRRPSSPTVAAARTSLELTLFDAAVEVGLVTGSVRHRSVVL